MATKVVFLWNVYHTFGIKENNVYILGDSSVLASFTFYDCQIPQTRVSFVWKARSSDPRVDHGEHQAGVEEHDDGGLVQGEHQGGHQAADDDGGLVQGEAGRARLVLGAPLHSADTPGSGHWPRNTFRWTLLVVFVVLVVLVVKVVVMKVVIRWSPHWCFHVM